MQNGRVYAQLRNRPRDRHGIDFSPLRGCQLNNVQMPHLHSDDFLAPPAQLLSTALDESAATDFDAEVTVTATRDGVHARHLRLVSLPADPDDHARQRAAVGHLELGHAFFPAQQPIAVVPGDEISMRIESSADGSIWRWRIAASRGGVLRAAYDQTSTDGFPGPPTRGATPAPGPRTTLKGEVVAWVLEAMDGTRDLAQLEAGVRERFGGRFTDPEDAVALVRETAGTLGR